MLVSQQQKLRDFVAALAEEHGRDRSALLPILQQVQRRYFYISEYAMQVVADLLDIHPVEVHSVATFYSFLDTEPRGEFVIRLCRTISCMMKGTGRLARQIENDLGIAFGETTPDGKFTLEWANCLGMCDQGPAMLVNDDVHTELTPEMVHEILEDCRQSFGPRGRQTQEDEHE